MNAASEYASPENRAGVDAGRGWRAREATAAEAAVRRRGGRPRRRVGARADQVAQDQLPEALRAGEEVRRQRDHADVPGEPRTGLRVHEPGDQGHSPRRARPILHAAADQDLGIDDVPVLDPRRGIDVLGLRQRDLAKHQIAPAPLDERELARGPRQHIRRDHVGHAVAEYPQVRGAADDGERLDPERLARIRLAVTRVDVRLATRRRPGAVGVCAWSSCAAS